MNAVRALSPDASTQESPPVETVRCGDSRQIYAVIARAHMPKEGYNFITENVDSLQVGVNHYASNTDIRPHEHLPLPRALSDTLEVLHIDSGRCLVMLYDDERKKFFETELRTGDTIVLMHGGHSLKILDETRIIEVKQGPYLGPAKDKVFF